MTGSGFTSFPRDSRTVAPVLTGASVSSDETVSTGAYPGKVVVLNVWGSWCAPCRKEAPDLVAASKETEAVAQFIGINTQDPSKDAAQAFVRAFEVPYPQLYDPDGKELVKLNGVIAAKAIPSTLIIDRQGRVAVRIVGVVSQRSLVDAIMDIANE